MRAKVEWSPVLRPAPRNASTGWVRVANHAGAAPKMIPVNRASANANASTTSEGLVVIGRKCALLKARFKRRRAAAAAEPARPAGAGPPYGVPGQGAARAVIWA